MSALLCEMPVEDVSFDRIARVAYQASGVRLDPIREPLVRARLAHRLRLLGLESEGEYLQRLTADLDGHECHAFIDSITSHDRCFFRDRRHFNYLARTLLPRLVGRARQGDAPRRIRGWSAGCGSGEEAYSISIVLSETLARLGEHAADWDVKLLATDASDRLLKKAQAGVYEADRVSTVGPGLRRRYFTPRSFGGEPQLAVSPTLRNQIVFDRLSLPDPWHFAGPFDFIFCRNSLADLDGPTRDEVLACFHHVLTHDGILVTGCPMTCADLGGRFRTIGLGIVQRWLASPGTAT